MDTSPLRPPAQNAAGASAPCILFLLLLQLSSFSPSSAGWCRSGPMKEGGHGDGGVRGGGGGNLRFDHRLIAGASGLVVRPMAQADLPQLVADLLSIEAQPFRRTEDHSEEEKDTAQDHRLDVTKDDLFSLDAKGAAESPLSIEELRRIYFDAFHRIRDGDDVEQEDMKGYRVWVMELLPVRRQCSSLSSSSALPESASTVASTILRHFPRRLNRRKGRVVAHAVIEEKGNRETV